MQFFAIENETTIDLNKRESLFVDDVKLVTLLMLLLLILKVPTDD